MNLAEQPPPYCSSCYGAYPERPHIDFEATWDGPVIDHEAGTRQAIDDLIVCEECLAQAAGLLGYAPPATDERDETIAALEQRVADLTERLRSAEHYAQQIEDAISQRSQVKRQRQKAAA